MNLEAIKAYIKKYPVGTGAVLVSLILSAALWIRHDAAAEKQAVFDTTVVEGQRLTDNIAHSAQLEEQFHELEEANKAIESRLVNPSDLAINLQYFYKLEAETGVKLIDTRPSDTRGNSGKTAVKGAYVPVQYVISLQGKFSQTLALLRRLEQGTYYCRILSGNCSQAQAEQEKGGGDIVMSLTVELLGRS